MFGKNWLRIASGAALLITAVCVVTQSVLKNELGDQLYYGTSLMAVFGYLFLTSRGKGEGGSPWWW